MEAQSMSRFIERDWFLDNKLDEGVGHRKATFFISVCSKDFLQPVGFAKVTFSPFLDIPIDVKKICYFTL